MKEILPEIDRWKEDGEKVVVATVVATRRSAPRPIGASLAISESGKMCGSVSGGCVESDVFENAQEVLATGEPKLVSYGIEDDLAWSVGLPCGGEIDVFLERVEYGADPPTRGAPRVRGARGPLHRRSRATSVGHEGARARVRRAGRRGARRGGRAVPTS